MATPAPALRPPAIRGHRQPVIITLTPNPSLDLLFSSDRLVWDDANRVPMPRRRPGGQGINLVRAARALRPENTPGADTAGPAGTDPARTAPAETDSVAAHPVAAHPVGIAVAALAGSLGSEIKRLLEREGTPVRPVGFKGETRIFVGARESATGRSLLLNPRGPRVEAGFADRLLEEVAEALPADGAEHWVACCGSLLPGLPADFYDQVGRLARERNARFVPDCDGEALAAAAPVADLLVPNEMEAERLTGLDIEGPDDAERAGLRLLDFGPAQVAITLGARGAVLATATGSWWAHPELPEDLAAEAEAGSAVGAGDAFLAALLLADPVGPHALAHAVATGTAVLLGRDSTLVAAGDVARVRPHVRLERLR